MNELPNNLVRAPQIVHTYPNGTGACVNCDEDWNGHEIWLLNIANAEQETVVARNHRIRCPKRWRNMPVLAVLLTRETKAFYRVFAQIK